MIYLQLIAVVCYFEAVVGGNILYWVLVKKGAHQRHICLHIPVGAPGRAPVGSYMYWSFEPAAAAVTCRSRASGFAARYRASTGY